MGGRCGASRRTVPRHEAARRDLGLGPELHAPGRGDEAHAREGVDQHAHAVVAPERCIPCIRLIATHRFEHARVACNGGFHFARQRERGRHIPLRQYTRVHHQRVVLEMRKLARRQPGQQRVAVGCLQNFLHGVARMDLAVAGVDSEQEQVVVAEHHRRSVAKRHDQAQGIGRFRAAIHQVACEPQAVVRRIEADPGKEAHQFIMAALDVADRIGRHQGRSSSQATRSKICASASSATIFVASR